MSFELAPLPGYTVERGPLPLMTTLPEGMFLHLARDDKASPFVVCSEFAVIDPTPAPPQHQDLILAEFTAGRKIQILTLRRGEYFYRNPWEINGFADRDAWRNTLVMDERLPASYRNSCDGPICVQAWLEHYSRGRVVGIYVGRREEDL